jgi:nitric oxide reductase subunit B
MHPLPHINIYTHGTQGTASHGHLAFFGAYATINIAVFYMAIQKWRGNIYMSSGIKGAWRWKWALALLNLGVLGMTIALMISGYEQAFVERALEGSTWAGYFKAQTTQWFMQGMYWRQIFGYVTAIGVVLLVWDLIVLGKHENKNAIVVGERE